MNNVLSQNDKRDGRPYPKRLIQGFQEVLADCELLDINLISYLFTCERGHGTDNWIEVRLDRALVTTGFINCFKKAKLTNMEITTYDHCPILLDLIVSLRYIMSSGSDLRMPGRGNLCAVNL